MMRHAATEAATASVREVDAFLFTDGLLIQSVGGTARDWANVVASDWLVTVLRIPEDARSKHLEQTGQTVRVPNRLTRRRIEARGDEQRATLSMLRWMGVETHLACYRRRSGRPRETIMQQVMTRGSFLNLAALFEGSLFIVALGLGWVADIDPLARVRLEWSAAGWGIAGALPLLAVFLVSQKTQLGPLRRINDFLRETLGPLLAVCRWYDLVLLALLAGVCEETLFRGLVQPWLEKWSPLVGLIGANVLFGLAHFITPTYAILAAGTGVYLSLLMDIAGSEQRNLLIPILAHAVYDFLAFLVVVRDYRRRPSAVSDSETHAPEDDDSLAVAEPVGSQAADDAPSEDDGSTDGDQES